MNTNRPETGRIAAAGRGIGGACKASCRGMLARLAQTRQAILAEARLMLGARERLIRLALNEAEALAWQTRYPHLFFPALAMEKVQALANWEARQRRVRRASLVPVVPPDRWAFI